MNKGAVVDRLEEIKWWDVLDTLLEHRDVLEVGSALRRIRPCVHPDAQFLASLFPADHQVASRCVEMLEQNEDPRAMFLAWMLAESSNEHLLMRAAELGYAPAQAVVAQVYVNLAERVPWFEKAVAQGDRRAMRLLGSLLLRSEFVQDKKRALELYREAAELGDAYAMFRHGDLAYSVRDWERYYWSGRAAERQLFQRQFCIDVARLLPSFERGENGRILHTAAPFFAGNLCVAAQTGFVRCEASVVEQCVRVVELHKAMLGRARGAIRCWSVAARRLNVAKDIRFLIAKMA